MGDLSHKQPREEIELTVQELTILAQYTSVSLVLYL